MTDASPSPSPRACRTAVKIVALVALLVLHFLTRVYDARTMPLAGRHIYPRSYGFSLSLMSGQGLRDVVVSDDSAARPIKEFLLLERNSVSAEEFAVYRSATRSPGGDREFDIYAPLATTRILDLYLAAGLWRCFGISWSVIFTFYALVSTATCFLIFLIARRLGDNFWAGWLAALMFFASPLEQYLGAWSLRDTSPLWFTAAAFCFLICVVDRCRDGLKSAAAYFGLGLVTMVGIGWRTDVLLLVPFLGASLVAVLINQRQHYTKMLTAVALFALGCWLCQAGVHSLSHLPVLPSASGFHMAEYADYSRSNLLGVENSFQTCRCDMQTLYTARRFERVHNENSEPLVYLRERYNSACRQMFCEEAQYNLYRWLRFFPRFLILALDGLRVPNAWDTVDPWQRNDLHLPEIEPLQRSLFDPISAILPYLFSFCAVAAIALGPRKLLTAMVVAFAVYYAAILFLVLPEQKHTAPLLAPLCIVCGLGLQQLVYVISIALRRREWRVLSRKTLRNAATTIMAMVVLWGLACWIARPIGAAARRELIGAIQTAAHNSVDAPETLKGRKVFAIQIAPGETRDFGYLLKIHAGQSPATLSCRHIHFPRDWGWPRTMTSRHSLIANREQFFFVTCLPAGIDGDPRPYSCTVSISGDAEIDSARRVELTHWNRLPVSTVFYEGQVCAGSPRENGPSAVSGYASFPVFANSVEDELEQGQLERRSQFVAPVVAAPPSHPLCHLAARSRKTGLWSIAASDGKHFLPRQTMWHNGATSWLQTKVGDFTGDGMDDLAGFDHATGQWWITAPDSNTMPARQFGSWSNGNDLVDICAGDFNGDGIDDLAGRDPKTGQWRVAISDGRSFRGQDWGRFANDGNWKFIHVGDFNGDGKADLAGWDAATGQWQVAISTGSSFEIQSWGQWSTSADWEYVVCGDFNGDGKTDLAGWDAKTGRWTISISNSSEFVNHPAGDWPTNVDWQNVRTGDFNGDGRTDIVARNPATGEFLVAISHGEQFESRAFGDATAFEADFVVGDFDGDGRDDIATRDESTGIVWVGTSNGAAFQVRSWAEWSPKERLEDIQVLSFWKQPKRVRGR